ncbi:membrane associated rhomboid family serine protease [Naumannella halotolerans]|uniref:Membrane associated rhomboid family serine protease n=2 Tax=Naumannella halotolerans TaxID=993414 RepID=A0A4R7J697_9ACTN|nr:membrane associated rhomboid family serine protease [Naumannella halotolerans]
MSYPGPSPVPDPDHGPSDDARFVPCYRHSDRTTGITCQRCRRPICGECMRPASVGFQCPDCIGAAEAGVRQPKRPRGRSVGPSAGGFGIRLGLGAPTILSALVVVVGILDLLTGGMLTQLLAWSNGLAAQGQLWRALTWVLVPGSVLSMLINVLMILLIGGTLEDIVGNLRTAVLYFLSALGGAAAIAVLGGAGAASIGATAAIFGLLAANATLKYRQGMDVRPDLILFALFAVMNLVFGGLAGSFVQLFGLLGGVIGGFLGGIALGWAKGAGAARDRNQWLLLAGVTVGLAAVTAAGVLLP